MKEHGIKISNTTIEQTQAIEGWRQTIRQIGRGMVEEFYA